MDIDLKRLADFFAPEDIEWKPIAVSKKTSKALAAAYVTNRAIMDRLDAVCGPENWRNEYREGPQGGVLCGISIRIGDEWVTKWDGAENTDIEAVKGGLSSAMRRAGVQWGIGRYLYNFPQQWVPVDQYGKFAQEPRIPPAYLPAGTKEAPPKANGAAPKKPTYQDIIDDLAGKLKAMPEAEVMQGHDAALRYVDKWPEPYRAQARDAFNQAAGLVVRAEGFEDDEDVPF